MKSIIRAILLFILAFFVSWQSAYNQNIRNKVKSFTTSEVKFDYTDLYNIFSRSPKIAIPLLIESIDTNVRGFVGRMQLEESNVGVYFNYVGIRSAMMVEQLLTDNKVSDQSSHYLIAVYKKGNSTYDKITLDDMKKIKKIYFKWWEENKMKNISEIKKSWQNQPNILKVNGYLWY